MDTCSPHLKAQLRHAQTIDKPSPCRRSQDNIESGGCPRQDSSDPALNGLQPPFQTLGSGVPPHSTWWARSILLFALLFGCVPSQGQTLLESFATDPVAGNRFVQQTSGTQSQFIFNSAAQSLTALLDVDSSPAFYLSQPFADITEGTDASFSVRFRIDAIDDQNHPAAFIGFLTDQHVGDFGDGLVLVISLADGVPIANAGIESFDQSYSGSGVPLELHTEYLAVGRFRSASRQFAIELFGGAGLTNLTGFSTITLPADRILTMNRLGLQNAGAREIDSPAGSITLTLDDLFTPAKNPRQITVASTLLTEGDSGTTNAIFRLQVSPASSLPVSVAFATSDGTAQAGADFVPQQGTVTFPPGITSATIAVPVLGDTLYEGNETLSILLSNPVGASLASTTATCTILENDPLPLLSVADAGVLEGNSGVANLRFLVTLSAPSGQDVTVSFATSDGTAIRGQDYQETKGLITFLPGEMTNGALVPVLGDTALEGDETFALNLSNPIGAAIAKAQGIGTILDDDSQARLSINDVARAEGNSGATPFVFTVSLTRASGVPVSFSYSVASSTAIVGSDLPPASGTVTLPPGTLSTNLTILVQGDTNPELDEVFTVNLSNLANATAAKAAGLGTILNDDALPEISIEDIEVTEGDAGTKDALFPLKLSFAVDQPVTVKYLTADGTALASSDYQSRPGAVTFAPGTTTQSIPIPILGDLFNEAAETFFVQVSSATLGRITRARATGAIIDNDPLPAIAVENAGSLEGDSGTANAVFALNLSTPSGQPVLVSYNTEDGTALSGSDYVAAFGTVTFPPGTTSQSFSIAVKGDTLFEPDETFFVRFSNPAQAVLSTNRAAGVIINDDPAPQLSVSNAEATEKTGGTNAVFNIFLSKPSLQAPVTVDYETADGSALAGRDYEAVSGHLTFAPGQTQLTIRVPILDDLLHEEDETFELNLSHPTNAFLVVEQARGTIHDNDSLPRLSIQNDQVFEGDTGTTDLLFELRLNKPSGAPVIASFATRNGTAVAGDYLPASGNVRLEAGTTNGTIRVMVNGDLIPEPDETFTVELTQVTGAEAGNLIATGTILDDDVRRVSIADTSVQEGATGTTTPAVFTISLNKASAELITVQYTTEDGTATAGLDYLPAGGLVTFPPGSVSQTVSITVNGDDQFEFDETFFVNLAQPQGAEISRARGQGTIVNDEDALVIVPAGLEVVVEDCQPPNGAVDPGESVTVSFALSNSGTIPSSGLTATLLSTAGITPLNPFPQSYGMIPAKGGPVTATFTMRADGQCGDALEAVLQLKNGGTNLGNVSFPFRLGTTVGGQAVCCNSADLSVGVTATPNPVVVAHPVTYSIQVTNLGPKTATEVRMTNVWRKPITFVSATLSQGSYTNQGDTLVCNLGPLNPGASATIQAVVSPVQVAPLIAVFYAKAPENDPALANNTASIATQVSPPQGISIGHAEVKEGDTGQTNLVFTLQLLPPTGREVRVSCVTSDGSAFAPQDYTATQGTVVFPGGTTTAAFSVPVIGDRLIEPDKAFFVTLHDPVNAPLAVEQTTALGKIIDDDFPTLSVEDVRAAEPPLGSTTNAVFVAVLSAALQKPASIDFNTVDGTARAPEDYQRTAGQLLLNPGATTAAFAVPIQGDPVVEAEESFTVQFSSAAGVNLSRTQAKGTILDNSAASLPLLSVGGGSVLEGRARTTTNVTFNLFLSRPSAQLVQVDYVTANNSALGGSDFVISSGRATIPPGQTNAVISVIVNGDDIPELDETFFLRLTNAVNAILTAVQAQATIVNDDYLPALVPGPTQLVIENCQPGNRAIDPLETVTVDFAISNRGLGPTTNLTASLISDEHFIALSDPQTYGALQVNAPAIARSFKFMVNGECGHKYTAELQLRDGGAVVGSIPFDFTLGKLTDGQYTCCSSADLGVTVLSSPDPIALASELTALVTITNRGPSVATGLLLTNKFSAPIQFVSSTSSGECTHSQDQLVCALPDLAPGQSWTLTNVFQPTQLGDLFEYVLVGGAENDPIPADNLAVAATKVVPPTGLSIEDMEVTEGDQNRTVQFTVRLWPASAQTVTVDYSFSNGSAVAGQDFVSASGSLAFPPQTTETILNVTLIGDTINEPDEFFFANLLNARNAIIARGQGRATILDDDPPILSINDVAVNVGTNGSAVAVLTVSLSTPARAPVSVDYFTVNGTAAESTDYQAQRSTLRIDSGSTSNVILIPIIGNTSDESEEEFFVELFNPRNASLGRSQGIVTITAEAPVGLFVSDTTVNEGASGKVNATFSVNLRKAIEHDVRVDYFTSDGTATAGSDYIATRGSLLFPAGTTNQQVNVPVLGDQIYEGNETFYLHLTNALNGVISSSRGAATIIDDENLPCLSIEDGTTSEGDSGTVVVPMQLHLSGPSSAPVSVDVTLPNCASVSPSKPAVQQVIFAPGQVLQSVQIPILGDTIYEPDEICAVVLSNPQNAAICDGQATLTIVNDDRLPGIEISDVSVNEGSAGPAAARFAITLVGATKETVRFAFSTSDGTALANSDYTPVSGVITMPPGVASTNLTVYVTGDTTVEPDETFSVNLSQPVNAALFKAQGIATIRNDDDPPQVSCPSVVVLASPGNQTCFQPFSAIVLDATPDQAAEQIERVEFYLGSTLLGVDSTSPFEIVWEGAPVGDYCLTAKAFCQSGRIVESGQTCIGVTASGASIAIVQNSGDPEINAMREYLLEMGYCARVFDKAEAAFSALSGFQLVIWDDLGAAGLSDSLVQTFRQLLESNIPLYFIGDQLASTAGLSAANQSTWSRLSHLVPMQRSGAPGTVAFSTEPHDAEPGSILSGRYAEIVDFDYSNPVALGRVDSDGTSLAVGAEADLLVRYPSADVEDVGQARTVSQSFRVLGGGPVDSISVRKALFRNAVCWLLRCLVCTTLNINTFVFDVPPTANVGDQFTYTIAVSNHGECVASGVVLTNHLPTGLSLVDLSFNQGVNAEYRPETRTLIWRVGSVISGTDNSAIAALTVRAVQAGQFHGTACGTANFEIFDESNCAEYDIDVQGTSLPAEPALTLNRTASELYRLQLTGQAGINYQLETSSDLRNWNSLTNAPGPVFYLILPDPAVPGSKTRFYRARWP